MTIRSKMFSRPTTRRIHENSRNDSSASREDAGAELDVCTGSSEAARNSADGCFCDMAPMKRGGCEQKSRRRPRTGMGYPDRHYASPEAPRRGSERRVQDPLAQAARKRQGPRGSVAPLRAVHPLCPHPQLFDLRMRQARRSGGKVLHLDLTVACRTIPTSPAGARVADRPADAVGVHFERHVDVVWAAARLYQAPAQRAMGVGSSGCAMVKASACARRTSSQ